MTLETLTDEQKSIIRRHAESLLADDESSLWGRWLYQMLRIIDAHAADRAALVSQLEAANGLLHRALDKDPMVRRDIRVFFKQPGIVPPAHAALVAQLEAAERARDAAIAGNARATEEARQLRERLSTEEGARSRSESLLQKTAWRLEALHVAAHAACGMWERTPSASLHDIRTAMRSLRDVLNKPNLGSNPDAALVAQIEELTRERDEAGRTVLQLMPEITRLQDEVARLTRWRDEMKALADAIEMRANVEVKRLTEALAAAERERADDRAERASQVEARFAAEARVRELEARIEKAITLSEGCDDTAQVMVEALRG